MPKRCSREDDERDLKILRLRDAGHTRAGIARHLGIPSSRVRTIINRVDADYQASVADAVQ